MLCDDCLHADICENITQGNCNWYLSEKELKGEWIPVSERLPEQANQSYLVTVDYGNGLIRACERFFFNSEIGWNDDYVIAWQPLPEPYKEGDAE